MLVMKELAKDIVRDGEGATKLIELCIEKAESHEEALRMARFIGTSNLAKCAMFGEDPNWGRILSSAGSSGCNMIAEQTDLFFGDVQAVELSEASADGKGVPAAKKTETTTEPTDSETPIVEPKPQPAQEAPKAESEEQAPAAPAIEEDDGGWN